MSRLAIRLTFIVLGADLAQAADVEGPRSKRIDNIVHRRVPADGPGAAVLVVREGKVVHSKGYGLADVEHKRPITPDTLFDLASVSKQFTALAIMILAEREKLSYRDDVRTYLPELPAYNKDRPIRVADLLHHTSGLTDYMELWEGTDAEFARLTNRDVLKLVARHKLGRPTGTKHEYSNTNYVLLALIVERASKMSFNQFLTKEIFQPAGMQHARMNDGSAPLPAAVARGYKRTKKGVKTSASPTIITGDGNLFCSITDMAKWDLALRDNKLVSAQTLKRAFTPGKLDNGRRHGYGFGWADDTVDDHRSVGHGGGWNGTSTYICRFLDDDMTVVVLSNDENFDTSALVDAVAKMFF